MLREKEAEKLKARGENIQARVEMGKARQHATETISKLNYVQGSYEEDRVNLTKTKRKLGKTEEELDRTTKLLERTHDELTVVIRSLKKSRGELREVKSFKNNVLHSPVYGLIHFRQTLRQMFTNAPADENAQEKKEKKDKKDIKRLNDSVKPRFL